MKNNLLPEVSAWYQDLASGSLFEVVAYDEEQILTVQLQVSSSAKNIFFNRQAHAANGIINGIAHQLFHCIIAR